MATDLLDTLRRLGATPGAVDRFGALAERPQTKRAGEHLINQHGPATHLHWLLDGWACRSRVLDQGTRATTAFVLGGELCDLDSLALGHCTSAVSVLATARVARAQITPLRALLSQEQSLAVAFQRLSAQQGLIAEEWLIGLGRRSAIERIAHLICELIVRANGGLRPAAARVEWPLTQTELADATGLSVVHVNRSLQTLKREANVAYDKRGLIISDLQKLEEIAGFDASYLMEAYSFDTGEDHYDAGFRNVS